MNLNNNLNLAVIASGDTALDSLSPDVADIVRLMRDNKLSDADAKTTAGQYIGGAMAALVESGKANDKRMGILFATAEAGDAFWKSEGDKSASKFFQRVTGASDTTFHAVKWAGETIYAPAMAFPDNLIARVAALPVSAGMLYELRGMSTEDISASFQFLVNPQSQKLWREIGKTARTWYKANPNGKFAEVVLSYYDANPTAGDETNSIKAWNAFKEAVFPPSASTASSASNASSASSASSASTASTTSTPSLSYRDYTIIRRGKAHHVGPMTSPDFGAACNAAGFISLTSGSLPGMPNADTRYSTDKGEFVNVTWAEIHADSIRDTMLADAMAAGDMDKVKAIATADDAQILGMNCDTVDSKAVTAILK